MFRSSEGKKCFNVYWKIKNFSYCWENITSPEFIVNYEKCWLGLDPKSESYGISCLYYQGVKSAYGQISFLTCDGSQEESSELSKGRSFLSLHVSKDVIFGDRRRAFLPKDISTIRCQFHASKESKNIFIHSQIGVKRNSVLWTLKYFSQQHSGATISVEDSALYGNIQLNLKSVGGINSDKQFYIEVYRSGGERCYSVLKVSVLDNEGKAANFVSDEFVFEKEMQQYWRFPPVIRNSKLLACKNLLLSNDTLSLKCDFAITLGKVTDQTVVYSYPEDVEPLLDGSGELAMRFDDGSGFDATTDLKTGLKSILDDRTLCDVNLQVGSDVIQAHKNILSARSPVFRAMFTKDMKETINNTVVIEDIDVDTIRRLLLYVYSDTIHDYQWEKIMNLYFAADKYEVLGLKQKCSSFLNANLSFSNVCDVLVLADLHQDQNLLSSVHDFVSKYETEVFASEAWRDLEKNNSPLAFQTLRNICSNKRLN